MKTKILFIIIALLLTACGPEATEEPTEEAITTDVPAMEENIPAPTDPPTEAPTEAPVVEPIETEEPPTCVTLLTPLNGVDIPAIGKATFTWTPLDGANAYALNIILPTGETVTFETDEATHDRYMEAFTAGGTYQWNVTALGADGSQICISEAFAFNKPALQNQNNGKNNNGNNDDSENNNSGNNNGEGSPPEFPTSQPGT